MSDTQHSHDTGRKKPVPLLRIIWGKMPLLFLVLLLCVCAALFMNIAAESKRIEERKRSEVKNEVKPVNVALLEIVPTMVRDMINLPAMVEASDRLEVKVEVPGKVISVPVTEGQYVKKGTLLASLDRRDYENALSAAETAYDAANKNFKRLERLHLSEIIPETRFDEATTALQEAQTRLTAARLNLERTDIISPRSGTLNRLDAKEGMLLSPGDSVGVIIEINPVKVVVGIPEQDITEAVKLRTFEITLSALNDRTVTGTRGFTSREPDSLAHLYKMEIMVNNPALDILPGMFARVNIIKHTIKDAIAVPLYAIITRGDIHSVYLERNGVAESRTVTTGVIEGWQVEVTDGLEFGDRVIVLGQRSVGQGQRVNVIRTVTDPANLKQ